MELVRCKNPLAFDPVIAIFFIGYLMISPIGDKKLGFIHCPATKNPRRDNLYHIILTGKAFILRHGIMDRTSWTMPRPGFRVCDRVYGV